MRSSASRALPEIGMGASFLLQGESSPPVLRVSLDRALPSPEKNGRRPIAIPGSTVFRFPMMRSFDVGLNQAGSSHYRGSLAKTAAQFKRNSGGRGGRRFEACDLSLEERETPRASRVENWGLLF